MRILFKLDNRKYLFQYLIVLTIPSFFPQKILNKVTACLELRTKALQKPGKIEGISLEDLKKVDQSKGLYDITLLRFIFLAIDHV